MQESEHEQLNLFKDEQFQPRPRPIKPKKGAIMGNTWKVDKTGALVPIDQWQAQQAQKVRQADIVAYIDPDPSIDLWMPPSQNEIMANGPHNPQHHFDVKETADPMTSANGFVIRYSAICVLLLFLSVGAIWAITGTVYVFASLGLFGALGAVSFVVLTRFDYQHSSTGTERQKTAEMGRTPTPTDESQPRISYAKIAVRSPISYGESLMTTTTIDMNARAVERLQAAVNAFGQPKIVTENSDMVEAVIRTGLLLNSIMEEFIHYVYTPHPLSDGYLCVTASGYVKRGVIVPWGYNNKATTRSEKHRIRTQFKKSERKGHASLFTYDKYRRCWQLNIDKYPTLEAALSWFDVYQIPTQNPTGEAVPLR